MLVTGLQTPTLQNQCQKILVAEPQAPKGYWSANPEPENEEDRDVQTPNTKRRRYWLVNPGMYVAFHHASSDIGRTLKGDVPCQTPKPLRKTDLLTWQTPFPKRRSWLENSKPEKEEDTGWQCPRTVGSAWLWQKPTPVKEEEEAAEAAEAAGA